MKPVTFHRREHALVLWCGFSVLALSLLVASLTCAAPRVSSTEPGRWIDEQALPGAILHRSSLTGLVRALSGTFSFYGVQGTPEDIARMFLGQHAELFGCSPDTREVARGRRLRRRERREARGER